MSHVQLLFMDSEDAACCFPSAFHWLVPTMADLQRPLYVFQRGSCSLKCIAPPIILPSTSHQNPEKRFRNLKLWLGNLS